MRKEVCMKFYSLTGVISTVSLMLISSYAAAADKEKTIENIKMITAKAESFYQEQSDKLNMDYSANQPSVRKVKGLLNATHDQIIAALRAYLEAVSNDTPVDPRYANSKTALWELSQWDASSPEALYYVDVRPL